MEPRELLMTGARAVAVYALMLVVIRLSGKRTIGNFSAFDLLVALMLGEVVDEIIYGDVTFAQGMIPILTVAILQYANSWLSYWGHGMDKVLEGSPSIVVRHGRLQRDGMRQERMNDRDVMAELRLHGVAELGEVRLAAIEEWAEPLQKGDVGAAGKPEPGTKEEEAAPSRRTDSADALG
jgi:uncharacterized membrane protein YcaP (DUF421 family)